MINSQTHFLFRIFDESKKAQSGSLLVMREFTRLREYGRITLAANIIRVDYVIPLGESLMSPEWPWMAP